MTENQIESEEQALEQGYADWIDRQMYLQDSWADTHLEFVGDRHAKLD
jgi:hypothetical protein